MQEPLVRFRGGRLRRQESTAYQGKESLVCLCDCPFGQVLGEAVSRKKPGLPKRDVEEPQEISSGKEEDTEEGPGRLVTTRHDLHVLPALSGGRCPAALADRFEG